MYSREVWRLCGGMAALTLAAAGAGWFFWGVGPAAALALLGGLLTAAAVHFTLLRYQKIAELSRDLAGVYAGGDAADIRDQRPGELGALKDDLYKITVLLRRQADDLARQKMFLARTLQDIAHQLKTPLAAIGLETEVWQSPGVDPAEKDGCAARAAAQVERMDWLVQMLLKLSRLEASAVPFEKKALSAAALAARAAEGLGGLMQQRGVALSIDCPRDAVCCCDPDWTAEALTNLLKNAAEHTPAGGRVALSFRSTVLFDEFAVEDTGDGISDRAMPHLFERFWRGPDSPPGSVGIGLPLAKAIAEGQGGDLTAENLPGNAGSPRGARFSLRLYR